MELFIVDVPIAKIAAEMPASRLTHPADKSDYL
jgi:hypothetical protein